MKYVITGGAGFVGSHLLPFLVAEDSSSEINIIDHIGPTSNPELLEAEPLTQFIKLHRFDINDFDRVDQVVAGADVVIHLAGESFVDYALDSPNVFAEVNVCGTVNLLRAAQRHKVKRFVHVSTDEVWGHLTGVGRFHEDSTYQPRNPYSASKAAADHFVRAWGSTWDLDYVIVYFTNLYGPYQYPEKLIPRAIVRLYDGLPVTLYGNGSHIRSWLHVTDAVKGLLAAMREGRSHCSYIIGSEEECTNLELVQMLISISGRNPEGMIEFVTDRPGHDTRYAVDCSRAHRELGWVPIRTLQQGLLDTFHWYQTNTDWLSARKANIAVRKGLYVGSVAKMARMG